MATLIRLKRKKSTGNSGIILASGEPYYNLIDKRLYIGNTNGENISSSSKKHIAEITPIEAGATTVKFQIGEDENNIYEKKITADAIEGTISNATDAINVTSTISGTAISALFNMSNNKPTSAKSASSATKATYASDDSTTTIGSRFTSVNKSINDLETKLTTADTALSGRIDDLTTTVSSNIQGQLDSKQSTITGSATTITSNTLTANRALITNGDGKVAISDVSSVELKYLDGVTSNVQTQLDGKAAMSHGSHVVFDTSVPAMNGTATPGTATTVSRSDHVHPIDTSRAAADHTHKYAGSSSVGGSATSAVKLDSSAGNSTTPVYFSSGKPVACTSLDLDTSGNSATATKLKTGRKITLSGDVTGSTTFDGSAAVTITTKVAALEWKSF